MFVRPTSKPNMKQISIFAAIILAIAAAVFFMRDRDARADLENAEKEISTLSNKLSTTETRMMMLQGETNQMNLQISNHLARIAALAARGGKANDELQQLRQDQAAAKADLDKQIKRATDAEARMADLDGEIRASHKLLEVRESELARLRGALKESETHLAEFHARLQKSEADVVRLQLDMTDEAALRAQLDRLKRQWPPIGFAKTPKQAFDSDDKGAKDLAARVDTKATGYYLQMQPDGTVKLLSSFEAAGAPK